VDYDANNWLEILEEHERFVVWLFDYQIGEGATRESALEDAKANVRRWTEEP
jgi:hypothetical protein